jgi:hypothetical protein
MNDHFDNEAAYERAVACAKDPALFDSYPSPVHFISAENSRQGEMAVEALAEGASVAIIYRDGHEVLARNEDDGIVVEQRDAHGRPIAA